MKILLLVFVVACGGGNLPNWKTGQLAPEEQVKAKTVAAVVQVTIATDWESSPWFRMQDASLSFPIYLVVATDGTACFIPAVDAALANTGDRYPCTGTWRIPRRTR